MCRLFIRLPYSLAPRARVCHRFLRFFPFERREGKSAVFFRVLRVGAPRARTFRPFLRPLSLRAPRARVSCIASATHTYLLRGAFSEKRHARVREPHLRCCALPRGVLFHISTSDGRSLIRFFAEDFAYDGGKCGTWKGVTGAS